MHWAATDLDDFHLELGCALDRFAMTGAEAEPHALAARVPGYVHRVARALGLHPDHGEVSAVVRQVLHFGVHLATLGAAARFRQATEVQSVELHTGLGVVVVALRRKAPLRRVADDDEAVGVADDRL